MLLSSSNRKYPPFPLLSCFSVVLCLRCVLHHILLLIAYTFRENREFVFIIIVQFMMSANNKKNACQIYFVECVIKIRHILSVIHYAIRGAVCFQFTNSPCYDWENIYIYIYIRCLVIINKSEVWTITHCLGLGHETMVYAVCLSVFLWHLHGFRQSISPAWHLYPDLLKRLWSQIIHFIVTRYISNRAQKILPFPIWN